MEKEFNPGEACLVIGRAVSVIVTSVAVVAWTVVKFLAVVATIALRFVLTAPRRLIARRLNAENDREIAFVFGGYNAGLAWMATLLAATAVVVGFTTLCCFGGAELISAYTAGTNQEQALEEELAEPEEIEEPVEILVSAPPEVIAAITPGPCGEACREEIRASRSDYAPIERNEARYVLEQYNTMVRSSAWRDWTALCVERMRQFDRAELYTLYPAELLAGKALIEGMGCRYITARNGDGGVGPAQITKPSTSDFQKVARMLRITTQDVREGNCFHVEGRARSTCAAASTEDDYFINVLTGAVMLSENEIALRSRGVALLAYNHGRGNATKAIDKVGGRHTRRQISEFRGAIPCFSAGHGCPKNYVDRVLAGAVMVDRLNRGLPLTPLESLRLEDIPGWNPADDGE